MTLHRNRHSTHSNRVNLELESLENRSLLANAVLSQLHAIPADQVVALSSNSTLNALTPSQVKHAYGFDNLSFNNGTVAADGTGQTIAIVVANDDPNIANDLHVFDQTYGLTDPIFQKVNLGATTVDAGWSVETALDVEWAHAVAPNAKILLVEAASSSVSDLVTAVDFARNQSGVSVVSMSWGGSEFATETSLDQYFTTPSGHSNVAFVAASGDNGAWAGTIWPSVSTNVLAVGATSLKLNAQGNYVGESGWVGSGGGLSNFVNEPGYQTSVQNSGARTTPDVAYNGDPNTGYAVYSSVMNDSGNVGWMTVGGTSAGTPQWAGIIALADQGRVLAGKTPIDNAPAAVYGLSGSAFNDVTKGFNGYSTQNGYDLVTGRGTPNIVQTVTGLVGPSASSQSSSLSTSKTSVSVSHLTAKTIVSTTQTLDGAVATSLVKLNTTQNTATSSSTVLSVQSIFITATAGQDRLSGSSYQSNRLSRSEGETFNLGGTALHPLSEISGPKESVPQPQNQEVSLSSKIMTNVFESLKDLLFKIPPTTGKATPVLPELPALDDQEFKSISDSYFAVASEERSEMDSVARRGPVIMAGVLASIFAARCIINERFAAKKKLQKLHIQQVI